MEQLTPHSLKTALYGSHCALGAKIVPFAGWEMPLYYKGIVEEHHIVRQAAGLFDVSHMGRIHVTGAQAIFFLDWIGTNILLTKEDGAVIYSVVCRPDGTAVDDVLVLRQSATEAWVIANASNRDKVLSYLQQQAIGWQVAIEGPKPDDGILALQGPLALGLAAQVIAGSQELRPMHFVKHGDLLVSRSGYTGEKGVEIFGPAAVVVALWDQLLALGALPIGLGARDTLRLEMGYALYGHELGDTINPLESVASWTVKHKKTRFIASEAMQAVQNSPQRRYQYGLSLSEGIPRAGYGVWQDDRPIGVITSGSFSPSLKNGIAIAMVDTILSPETSVAVEIRGSKYPATVVSLPFYHPPV